jgi:hypothetical protein
MTPHSAAVTAALTITSRRCPSFRRTRIPDAIHTPAITGPRDAETAKATTESADNTANRVRSGWRRAVSAAHSTAPLTRKTVLYSFTRVE